MAGSIYQKIAKAMSNINRIPKRGYNSFHKYEYVLEADLLDHIRPILFVQDHKYVFPEEWKRLNK